MKLSHRAAATVCQYLALALFVCLALAERAEAQSKYRVVGYYPMWLRSSLDPRTIEYRYLTHIIHAFAWPRADGTLASFDSTADTALINTTHRAGRKILLSLGGAGDEQSGNFPGIAADPVRRQTFVQNVVAHIRTYQYDGADLDWEAPTSAADRSNEVLLIRDLRTAFQAVDSTLLITMAIGVTNWSAQWYDLAALQQSVDWFNAMAYDFHGSWSTHAGHNAPLYAPASDPDGSVDEGITYLRQTRRVPGSQLALGLPFYTVRFRASALYGPKVEPTEYVFYNDVLHDLDSGWTYRWDSVSQAPYAINPSGTFLETFDDTNSLALKCQYARDHQLSGVMIWALGQDLTGGREPLLEAVGKAMLGEPTAVTAYAEEVPKEIALFQNYPNPFNPFTTIKYTVGGNGAWGVGNGGEAGISVKLIVYDVLGREVSVLVDERKTPGSYEVRFDGSNLASGIYFYRLMAGSFLQSRRMILVK